VVYSPLFNGFASVGRGGGGRDFSSKMPSTMSNLPNFHRRLFFYAHLCFYTKSMGTGYIKRSHERDTASLLMVVQADR